MRFRAIALVLVLLAASPFTAPFSACDLATALGTSPARAAVGVAADTHAPILATHVDRAPVDSVLDDAKDATVDAPLVVTPVGVSRRAVVLTVYRTIEFRRPPVTLRL